MSRTIAVIGEGNVGGTLGKRWAAAGYDVTFGVRHPASADDGVKRAPVTEAVLGADVVVLATPANAAEAVVRGAGDLSGKIVIDCLNPLNADFSGIEQRGGLSLAEQIASWAPAAHVVKAFNTIGFNVMDDPSFGGEKAS